jgi:drug/metabolite transporter (DMT)-like permease
MISFYFGFKEKTNLAQGVGVIFMLGCIACIGFSGEDKDLVLDDKDKVGIDGLLAGIIAILCGLGAAVMMSTRQFFIRKYAAAYDSKDMVIDYNTGALLLFCIPAIILAY